MILIKDSNLEHLVVECLSFLTEITLFNQFYDFFSNCLKE